MKFRAVQHIKKTISTSPINLLYFEENQTTHLVDQVIPKSSAVTSSSFVLNLFDVNFVAARLLTVPYYHK